MTILGFDTATRATAVALWSPDGLALGARDDPPPGERPRHTTRLMALIIELLDRAGLSWDDLERVAVGVGPGTFTGLRIGVATARGLALARRLPLVGISTLESLALGGIDAVALGTTAAGIDAVAAVIDARRGEVFSAAWSRDRRMLMAPSVLTPDALAKRLGELGARVLALGDGAVEFRGVLERSGALVAEGHSGLHRVNAINHCRLAAGRPPNPPDHVQPEYLRLPDAEIARRAADTL
jgi:tRNA threonylcarbamoyladenosine biosynthesis protein TsaB